MRRIRVGIGLLLVAILLVFALRQRKLELSDRARFVQNIETSGVISEEKSEILHEVFAEITELIFLTDYDIIASFISEIEDVVIVEIIKVTEDEQTEILSKVSHPEVVRFIQVMEGERARID